MRKVVLWSSSCVKRVPKSIPNSTFQVIISVVSIKCNFFKLIFDLGTNTKIPNFDRQFVCKHLSLLNMAQISFSRSSNIYYKLHFAKQDSKIADPYTYLALGSSNLLKLHEYSCKQQLPSEHQSTASPLIVWNMGPRVTPHYVFIV